MAIHCKNEIESQIAAAAVFALIIDDKARVLKVSYP